MGRRERAQKKGLEWVELEGGRSFRATMPRSIVLRHHHRRCRDRLALLLPTIPIGVPYRTTIHLSMPSHRHPQPQRWTTMHPRGMPLGVLPHPTYRRLRRSRLILEIFLVSHPNPKFRRLQWYHSLLSLPQEDRLLIRLHSMLILTSCKRMLQRQLPHRIRCRKVGEGKVEVHFLPTSRPCNSPRFHSNSSSLTQQCTYTIIRAWKTLRLCSSNRV